MAWRSLSLNAVAPNPQLPCSMPASDAGHFASLDGLRGIACLLIVWLHCFDFAGRIPWPIVHAAGADWRIYTMSGHASVGVELFFSLSGFCLALPFMGRSGAQWNWKRYILRRCRRILPTYWIALSILMVVHLLIEHFQIDPLAGHMLRCTGTDEFVLALTLIRSTLNATYWTLPVEFRWYFILPLMLLCWRRWGMKWVWALALASTGASAILVMLDLRLVSFYVGGILTVLPLFTIGVYVADLFSGRVLGRGEQMLLRYASLGLALSFIPFLLMPLNQDNEYYFWICRIVSRGPLVFFALISAVQPTWVKQVCVMPALQKAGLFSYSLYLIHTPIIQGTWLWLQPKNFSPATYWIVFHGPVPVACVLTGYLFYLVAEKPFLVRRSPAKPASLIDHLESAPRLAA